MTKKQRELLNFITRFIAEHGYSPSYREIMRSLDYKSVSTVATHVDNLTALGVLRKMDHSARSLEVVDKIQTLPKQAAVSPSQEKWLVDIVAAKFSEIDVSKAPPQKQVDDLFVLVGALHVLGFSEAAAAFKEKLKAYR